MNIFQAITMRRSIRKFSDKAIDEKLIGLMLHMATYAPSAGNMQEWEFVVVDDKKIKERLANAALKQKQVVDAPIDIIVCANLDRLSLKVGKRGEVLYAIQGTAAAITNMLLAATALGLGLTRPLSKYTAMSPTLSPNGVNGRTSPSIGFHKASHSLLTRSSCVIFS